MHARVVAIVASLRAAGQSAPPAPAPRARPRARPRRVLTWFIRSLPSPDRATSVRSSFTLPVAVRRPRSASRSRGRHLVRTPGSSPLINARRHRLNRATQRSYDERCVAGVASWSRQSGARAHRRRIRRATAAVGTACAGVARRRRPRRRGPASVVARCGVSPGSGAADRRRRAGSAAPPRSAAWPPSSARRRAAKPVFSCTCSGVTPS